MKILTAEQIRACETEAVNNGISLGELMLRAGTAAANEIKNSYEIANKSVLIVCGNGNNGGDGFVMASVLSSFGANVSVFLPMGAPKTDIAREHFDCMQNVKTVAFFEDKYDIIVDALFGIGLTRGIDGELGELVDRINLSNAVRISVDVPSGVSADGGVLGKAVRAELTLTMIAAKPCFFLPPASDYCGEVKVLDIGAPVNCYSYLTITPSALPKRAKNSHKGTFGKALLVCGSYGMCGAEILASRAALRTGVGILQAVVCDKNYAAFCAAVPEAVTYPVPTSSFGSAVIDLNRLYVWLKSSDAVLIGCGMGSTEETQKIVRVVLSTSEIPIVLDADGINVICSDIELLRKTKAPLIITPHPGEMARLCKTDIANIEADRVGYATRFASENSCIVVLKGANTIVASPDGRVFFNTTGNPGLATGGSGDVLAGIMVSLLAQGESPLTAAKDAVYIHGAAADRLKASLGERFMLPSDIIEELKTPELA